MTDNRTTELRRLLDERGIIWMDVYRPTIFRTCWRTGDADVYCYFDEDKSTGLFELHISGYDFTPEQAIAAALGSGTCNPVETEALENVTAHVMECDRCGKVYEHVNGAYEHCPRCGRRVER